jgi:hypothetical protein
MEGEAKPAEVLQSGETGRVQLLKLCLWYSDDRAHATGHCLSAALLHPGSELRHVVECHEPPIDEVSRFRAVYFTNHEDRVQVSPLCGVKGQLYERPNIQPKIWPKVARRRRGLLLYLKWVSMLLSPKYSVDVGYFREESGLKSDAEVFLRELLRDGNGGDAGRLCLVPKKIVGALAPSKVQRSRSIQKRSVGLLCWQPELDGMPPERRWIVVAAHGCRAIETRNSALVKRRANGMQPQRGPWKLPPSRVFHSG